MIKNFIFDVGNVLVDFSPIKYFESLLPNRNMTDVCALVFDEVWDKMDEGIYMEEDVRQQKLTTYPAYHEQINCIFANWKDMMVEKSDSVAYMQELKEQGYAIYILSNIGKESHAYLRKKYKFFDIVDGMVLSYEHQCIKPDERIYKLLLETYQLKNDECLFFDDRKENIESARAIGIPAIQFHTLAQIKKEVDSYVNNT